MDVYWPGISEQQLEGQPAFSDDGHAWGNWMAEREGAPEVLQTVIDLGAAPILTVMTDGWGDEDVAWVTPQELHSAAQQLRRAVQHRGPRVSRLLEVYARHANPVDPVADQFLADLADIEALTLWAEREGASKMTLRVNW